MFDSLNAPTEGHPEGHPGGTRHPIDELMPALRRLDSLIARAVGMAQGDTQGVPAPGGESDLFRGLYISPDEVDRALAREPGRPTLYSRSPEEMQGGHPGGHPEGTRLAWLGETFSLSPFDLDLLLIALAPELDLRYERLYAYLQDDVTRKRPSVDLALNLLCATAEEKLERRAHVAADAPLIRQDLLYLIPDPNQVHPPLLAHYLKLDDQVVRLLLGQRGLDHRLYSLVQVVEPAEAPDEPRPGSGLQRTLYALVTRSREPGPLRLYFRGPSDTAKRRTAEALASEMGARLLVADIGRILASAVDAERTLKLLFREAWLQEALLYLEGLDALAGEERLPLYRQLLLLLAEHAGTTVLAGSRPLAAVAVESGDIVEVPFVTPDFAERRACWEANLEAAGMALSPHDLDALAGRFRLTTDQIAGAVAGARNRARWRQAARPAGEGGWSASPSLEDLFGAARTQSGQDLAALAQKIEPVYSWEHIVLPEDALAQLREICQRVVHQHQVFGAWGFGRRLSLGKGINALFAGPSGTGKTMAAEIIAGELGLDLYRIDLSGVVSKYIGETEKNLDRIFTAAESANAILFFDEADALFGKRSEVRDSHDRYANIEISYLLQKMEQYEGIAILATNLRGNLDESFTRRLAFSVAFPFPEEEERRRIWEGIFPGETPLEEDVDRDFLARQFRLSGGNIKNITLAAAFLAAADGGRIGVSHLLHAVRREYGKMGRMISEAELLAMYEARGGDRGSVEG